MNTCYCIVFLGNDLDGIKSSISTNVYFLVIHPNAINKEIFASVNARLNELRSNYMISVYFFVSENNKRVAVYENINI